MMPDAFDEFRRKNNYRRNTEAKVCCNCVHYWELYEERTCNLASSTSPDGKRVLEMWTEPNFTCNKFANEHEENLRDLDK